MPHKLNRAFKRGEGHRDLKLFVIVAEGHREDRYFAWFNERNQRIRVQIVPREENKSAPNHFLERLGNFLDREEITPAAGDSVWFVLDVDSWKREHIEELIQHCEQYENFQIAISNPCFEVWLNFHAGPLPEGIRNCHELKTELPNRIPGGFHPDTLCPLIETAIHYAQQADTHPTQNFPDQMQTKVHRLASQIQELMGKNR